MAKFDSGDREAHKILYGFHMAYFGKFEAGDFVSEEMFNGVQNFMTTEPGTSNDIVKIIQSNVQKPQRTYAQSMYQVPASPVKPRVREPKSRVPTPDF